MVSSANATPNVRNLRPASTGTAARRRSVSFNSSGEQGNLAVDSSDAEQDTLGSSRDIVVPIAVSSDFKAFGAGGDDAPPPEHIHDVVSQGSSPPLSPRNHLSASNNGGGGIGSRRASSRRSSSNRSASMQVTLQADGFSQQGDGSGDDDDRVEFTAEEIPSSLFIFSGTNPIRVLCLHVVQSWAFHQIILACIVANSVTLAMDQPAVNNPEGLKVFLDVTEYLFTAVFLLEMLLKVIAFGFVLHAHSYLRTPWNVLDCIIVLASLASLFTSSSNVSALRVVRVLRPLRSVSRIKNLRMLIAGLFAALPEVVNNLLLFAFLTLVFAVAAVQLWSGKLSQRCYVSEFERDFASDPRYANLTSPFLQRDDTDPCGGNHDCVSSYANGSAISCAIHRDLYKRRNLNYDNFFSASLLVFKVMVFDNWPDDLNDAQNAIGPTAIIFFVLLTLIGGYVCVNLFLAVLTQGYSKAAHQIQNEEEFELADIGVQTDFESPTELSVQEQKEVNAQVLAITAKRKKEERRARRAIIASTRFSPNQPGGGSDPSRNSASLSPQSSPHGSTRVARHSAGGSGKEIRSAGNSIRFEPGAFAAGNAAASGRLDTGSIRSKPSAVTSPTGNRNDDEGFGTQVEMMEGELQHIPEQDTIDRDRRRARLRGEPQTVEVASGSKHRGDAADDDAALNGVVSEGSSPALAMLRSPTEDNDALGMVPNEPGDDDVDAFGMAHIPDWDDDDFDFEGVGEFVYNSADSRCYIRQLVGYITTHKGTEIVAMLVTLLNVVVLAIDHYGIDPNLAYNLDIISLACTVAFTIEIALKLFAFGPACLKNGFNALDFLLVVIALITIGVFGWQDGGSISAFRALRVFRIFRLLNKFESLQTVIEGILQSVASIGYLSFLILLFLYVWGIMGMQVFGIDYGKADPEGIRDSFGTIWQSLILTFIVVTGDNWTDKMQVGMSSYSNGLETIPVVYFISLYMIGNFILINLSVAIIVDKLQEKMDALDARQNAEEHPPFLLIAPYTIGQMAYRDAVEAEIRQFHETKTMSGDGLLSQTMAHSKSFKRFRPTTSSSGGGMMNGSGGGDVLVEQPTLMEVLAPRTDGERATVFAALERNARDDNDDDNAMPMSFEEARIRSARLSTSNSKSADASLEHSPVANQSSPKVDFAAAIADSEKNRADNENTNDAPPANAFDAKTASRMQPVRRKSTAAAGGAGLGTSKTAAFGDTIDPDLAMRIAFKQQDDADAAEARMLQGSDDGEDANNVPLSSARYVDHLAEDRASAGSQCRMLGLYMKGFLKSTPPFVDPDVKSLWYFAVTHPVRRGCLYLVGLPVYNGAILLCIIANVVFLTLDGPGASDESLLSILISDYIFAFIFLAEMLIKIVALGAWIEVDAMTESEEMAADVADAKAAAEARDGAAAAALHDGSDDALLNESGGSAVRVVRLDADRQVQPDGPLSEHDALSVSSHSTSLALDDADDEAAATRMSSHFEPAAFNATGTRGPAAAAAAKRKGAKIGVRKVRPYFRDPWNCIDCFVTMVSIIGLFVPLLKALRALRTIRLVARIETTRIILVALMQAVPHVMHGLLLSLVVYLVFGILGVQLFKGNLYRCNDPAIELKSLCNGTWDRSDPGPVFDVVTNVPRVWVRTTYHFDHLGAALMTLFVVSIGDGWSEIMFDGMDIVDSEHALRRNNSPWMSLYFITVFIACNFFAINMMIGILINYFSKKKHEQDGSAFLTPKQQQYVKARDIIAGNTVGEEYIRTLENNVSVKIAEFITYRHPAVQRISIFDALMLVFIIVNVVAVAAEHDNMTPSVEKSLNAVQLACLCIFTLEMFIKWAAYGPWYFSANWNRFDCTIVFVGWISFGLPAINFLAFLRVFRVIKLIRDTGVEKLIFMLIRSISSLLHVVTILLLTYFIFAVAGVALFGKVRFNGPLNENNNFRTVWSAMVLLYQCATTENWNGVMEAVSVQPPTCDESIDGDCGNPTVATTYFILFMVCCTFVALQLFVAIIVEIFDGDADNSDPIRNAFAEMRAIWIEQFGDETPRVHYTELIEVMPFFPPILTDFPDGEHITRADMIRLLASLPIPIDSKHHVRYTDLVNALAFKKYQVDPRTMGALVDDALGNMFVGAAFSMAQVYALDVIADLWLEFKGESLKAHASRRHMSPGSFAASPFASPTPNRLNRDGGVGDSFDVDDASGCKPLVPATAVRPSKQEQASAIVHPKHEAPQSPAARPITAGISIAIVGADGDTNNTTGGAGSVGAHAMLDVAPSTGVESVNGTPRDGSLR